MRFEAFLLGVIATSSVVASMFFFKFWKRTHDSLFFFFALAFLIEGINRTTVLFSTHPNERGPWIFAVRLVAFLAILAGIIRKNYRMP